MPSLRRSLLRRYRLFAPRLFRCGLWPLALLLLCAGIAVLYFPQLQAALSLTPPAGRPSRVYPGQRPGEGHGFYGG